MLYIDLKSIADNYHFLQSKLKNNTQCAAVVKADAYGLGAEYVLPVLQKSGCTLFFVATMDEAIILKPYLQGQSRIFVFDGAVRSCQSEYVHHYPYIVPVINHMSALKSWHDIAHKMQKKLDTILHIDTGMNRLGFCHEDIESLKDSKNLLDNLSLLGVISHMACADDMMNELNDIQYQKFIKYIREEPFCRAEWFSLANSGAVFHDCSRHLDVVRPGIALYGGNPVQGFENPMKPVVKLQARILQMKVVRKGENIGYGGGYKLEKDAIIATINLGYADGYFRSIEHKGYVSYQGVLCPILGRISMDLVTVDVSEIYNDSNNIENGIDDYIDIIGGDITIDKVAEYAGTISYEVLTALGNRYQRHYLNNNF